MACLSSIAASTRSRAALRQARRSRTGRSRRGSANGGWRATSGKRSDETRSRSSCRAIACSPPAGRPAASPPTAASPPSCACSRSNARAPAMRPPCSTAIARSVSRSSRRRSAAAERAIRGLCSRSPGLRRQSIYALGKDLVMNWISNVVRPKIRNYFARRDTPENLWIKCPETGQLVFYKDVEANQFVIPGSNYHMRMGAMMRLKSMFDNETWFDIAIPAVPLDPLKFRDEVRYADRLRDARTKTGTNDAIKLGFGKLEGLPVVIGVQDFDFMGGSLGMAAGEAVIKGLETAVDKGTPFIMFAASGGARMQEGIFSLMQLPRTTLAVQMLREARRPYIVVLTNPTTGGVTASYAMLGDIHLAEPGALIGFAGPRVIEQTIREKLPDGFQRAEYLRDHGMVDMVVNRRDLRPTLANLCRLLTKARPKPPVEKLPLPAAG